MKTTLLICSYNRPAYLRRCLASVKRAGIEDVLIVDDCSSDLSVRGIIRETDYDFIFKTQRSGICDSLVTGIEYAFFNGADIVINLDADAIIRNDYLQRMLELNEAFPDDIITGFHSTTKNRDGSERHKIVEEGFEESVSYCRKQSVGGINMLWTKETWNQMKPVIENAQRNRLNWDHEVSKASGGIICAVPSLVQHIGIESSMNHTEAPDMAQDSKMLSLPDVTLVCVDDNIERCKKALRDSTKDIDFAEVKVLSSSVNEFAQNSCYIAIPHLGSKQAYSQFIIKELHKYINTPYALIVQHDGYVKNPEAWSDEFMKYDFTGATWWYKDGMNVGNGGFSLRSRKLLQLTAKLNWPVTHPEDEIVCRTHRKELEQHGIKFAPDEVANKFSFEGYYQPGAWDGQFGFHGARAFRKPPDPRKQGFIINQFLGLGDILFLVPLIRYWMSLGHDVIWPIADEYYNIKENFTDIQFVRKSEWRMNYETQHEYNLAWSYGNYIVKPLRWNRCFKLEEAMTTEYSMYGLDYNTWRELVWERNYEKERRLAELVQAKGEYALVFQEYGNVTDGGAAVKVLGIAGVYSCRLPGYNLLDWAGIIENATIIHAVSPSCIYLFETLNLRAKEVHLYSRRLGQKDFDMVKPVLTKNYIYHT